MVETSACLSVTCQHQTDPEVSTLSTLTNVQNSLFVPDLGRFVNRRPTYNLSRHLSDVKDLEAPKVNPSGPPSDPASLFTAKSKPSEGAQEEQGIGPIARTATRLSITSALTESHYAVLPHGVSIADWDEGDKALLNDHVRHALHSRRAAFRRGLKGFGQYVRRRMCSNTVKSM